ncbi:MAG: SpoIID/LytB domain-containing protein, partial [Lachnospiraceae bacterium]|nr:SpoIID/LytB domain-containing protein [Lachnospiraceae bacterium]
MKKIFLFLFFVLLCCFIIPMVFVLKFESIGSGTGNVYIAETPEETTIPEVNYDYTQYGTINLLHKSTGAVEELPLDEYLYGVVSAEMPASYSIEALKAQAVVARTYTIYQISNNVGKHGEANICDDSTCCQAWISKEDRLARWEEVNREAYWNNILIAVNETAGKIIT